MRSVVWRGYLMRVLCVLLVTLVYNEFIVYYLVLRQCQWPDLQTDSALKAMFISDPHLLGPSGHWWDRLRREWQMQRTFQTSLQLHHPEIVFILGDLFDDGKWSSDEAFQEDVRRFHSMFSHSKSVRLVNVIGNHDVGFHYMIDQHKLSRFVSAVNSSDSVTLLSYKNITFVTANSMAFEGDDCMMCTKARRDLQSISNKLSCAQKEWKSAGCMDIDEQFVFSSPVLLQHYPMYRTSDEGCTGEDSMPAEYKADRYRPKYDCLSQQASDLLMSSVRPRLIISGHTHYFCLRHHDNGVPEWSVPSFSWRNHKGPSYLMVALTGDEYAVSKCFIPNENTVYLVYAVVITLLSSHIIYTALMTLRNYLHLSKAMKHS